MVLLWSGHWSLTEAEWSAIRLSLSVGACSTILCVLPGVFFGWLLARKNFFGKSLLDAVIHLPLVLPPVAVGYLLLLLLGRQGWIGQYLNKMGVQLAFTWQGAVLASTLMALPLAVRAIRLAIDLVNPHLEQAAANLGASPGRVFFTITLPLALPGLMTGMILAFARSMGEFGATITFAGSIAGETRTLPLAIFNYSEIPGGEAMAIRLMILSIVISFAALVVSDLLARRMIGRMVGN